MGLFEKLFPKKALIRQTEGFFQTLTAYNPVFTSWGGAVYESQLVRSAIDAIARNSGKLKVEIKGNSQPTMQTILKKRPNGFQTWSQYMYRLATILNVQNTAFIVPITDANGRTIGTFPVLPNRCEIVQVNGDPYLRYTFSNGNVGSMEMSKCGILTRHQYMDDFFGESNIRALRPTMELIDIQNQGIKEGVKSAATYRFMAKMNNMIRPEDLAKERKRFTEQNLKAEDGGILLFPSTYDEIKQINTAPFIVDAEQMRIIKNNVFDYYGVNEDVIQNKAYGDAWSAFYEGAIEPFAIQFSEVMTQMLFSEREQGEGSLIMATSNRLQYMTNKDKLEVSSQMADRGIFSRNEVREIWNLPPIEDGDKYIIRGEYYDASDKLNESEE